MGRTRDSERNGTRTPGALNCFSSFLMTSR
jgi:hypothetical protein